MIKLLTYTEWLDANEDELYIMAAETGADREFGFDSEDYCLKVFERNSRKLRDHNLVWKK